MLGGTQFSNTGAAAPKIIDRTSPDLLGLDPSSTNFAILEKLIAESEENKKRIADILTSEETAALRNPKGKVNDGIYLNSPLGRIELLTFSIRTLAFGVFFTANRLVDLYVLESTQWDGVTDPALEISSGLAVPAIAQGLYWLMYGVATTLYSKTCADKTAAELLIELSERQDRQAALEAKILAASELLQAQASTVYDPDTKAHHVAEAQATTSGALSDQNTWTMYAINKILSFATVSGLSATIIKINTETTETNYGLSTADWLAIAFLSTLLTLMSYFTLPTKLQNTLEKIENFVGHCIGVVFYLKYAIPTKVFGKPTTARGKDWGAVLARDTSSVPFGRAASTSPPPLTRQASEEAKPSPVRRRTTSTSTPPSSTHSSPARRGNPIKHSPGSLFSLARAEKIPTSRSPMDSARKDRLMEQYKVLYSPGGDSDDSDYENDPTAAIVDGGPPGSSPVGVALPFARQKTGGRLSTLPLRSPAPLFRTPDTKKPKGKAHRKVAPAP